MVNCNGPCEQGRKPCPCPNACIREEEHKPRVYWEDVVIAVLAVSVVGLIILGVL